MSPFTLLLFLSANVGLVSSRATCNLPPDYWCVNPEIAKRCHATELCEMFAAPSTGKVKVSVYYESRCPFSIRFILTELMKAYEKLSSIMTVDLVPFGNARVHKNGDKVTFTCQHGPAECNGNMVETCAVKLLPEARHLSLVGCISQKFIQGRTPTDAYHKCGMDLKLNMQPILTCASGGQGIKFQQEMAQRTFSLKPRKRYVPWIVVNGVHTETINNMARSNLIKLVCNTYKGPNKPAACSPASYGVSFDAQ